MLRTIYNYNDEFDSNVIFNKISEIKEEIQDTKEGDMSKEREDKVRKLMYAQFLQGLKLNTGYNYF